MNLRHRSLMLHDLDGTIQCAFVLVSFKTLLNQDTYVSVLLLRVKKITRLQESDWTNLHSGLNHIQGSVSKHTDSTSNSSKESSYHRVDGFVRVITLVFEKDDYSAAFLVVCVDYFFYLFIHSHTFVPVPQWSHDVEANGLVGALFQHGGC